MIIKNLPQIIYGIKSSQRPAGIKMNRTMPAGDIVVFKGQNNVHKKEKQVSSNILNAVNLADKLTQIPMETHFNIDLISEIVAQNSNNITIKPIEELSDIIIDSQNYGAFFTGILTEDFNTDKETIYLNTAKADISNIHRLSVIKDTAHEYTHALQMKEGKVNEFLKVITKGDYEYAKAIQGLGDLVFKPFDNEIQAYGVMRVFNNIADITSNKLYKFIYPREQEVSKQDILKSLGLKDEKEFKTFILKQFELSFNNILNLALDDPMILPMFKNQTRDQIKNKVKTYCRLSAIKEKEAYTVESIISKKHLNTDKSINLDIFPIYYSMLADALKES